MVTFCMNCSESIHKVHEDQWRDWRHKKTGSIFCAKKRGKRITLATPAPTEKFTLEIAK